ncbi:MAG: ADP-ribosylglycohydrolase family protein [Gemmataceae bacterium]
MKLISLEESITGCLIGMAVGDALGLPWENLSSLRIKKFVSRIEKHHFLFEKGMVSDDTEHLCLVAQSIISSGDDLSLFERSLSWRLRWWFLADSAGIGRATLLGCLKLLVGFSGKSSGVFSAGNGPAMRSPILGVCFGDDLPRLREWVKFSTRVTHTDPKAEYGAMAIALAAYLSANKANTNELAEQYMSLSAEVLGESCPNLLERLQQAAESAKAHETPQQFASHLGLKKRVTGYIYHTVPVVIQTWLRYPEDYETAIQSIIECGGDTDTTAGILGSILGVRVGEARIPTAWVRDIWEWPCGIEWMRRLGHKLARVLETGEPEKPLAVNIPGLALRNWFFFFVVLLHVGRRCLPPY